MTGRVDWRILMPGCTVWIGVGKHHDTWLAATVERLGKQNRAEHTRVYLRYEGVNLKTVRQVTELVWRLPKLNGEDRPGPHAYCNATECRKKKEIAA